MMKKRICFIVILSAVLLLGYLYYSSDPDEDEESAPVGEYKVLVVKQQPYTLVRDFATRIETEQPAEIRPQISGKITQICVKEGAQVKKGQPLIILDQVPYQAAVKNAEARVKSAKAQLTTARQALEGKEELFKQHVIGDFDLNKSRNEVADAEASLAVANAELETARNELSYTVIKSPSDGTLSMIEYRIGELVDPSMEKELGTVSDPRRIVAYMALSEKTLYDLTQYYACSVQDLLDKLPEVTLFTYWGKENPQKGHIDAFSGNVEAGSGAIYMRASFDNPDRLFRNGSNGVIQMPYPIRDAIVIPQEATYDILDKIFVFKVSGDKVHSLEIKVIPYNDGQNYVVTDGLSVGDTIIAEGAGLLKEGMAVKIKKQ